MCLEYSFWILQLADFFKDFEKKVYDSLLGCKCLGGVENAIGEGKCIGVAWDASGERKCVGVWSPEVELLFKFSGISP